MDAKSTTMHISNILGSLDKYIIEIGEDIVKLNIHIKGLIHSLKKYGKTICNLKVDITKGYIAYRDK